MTTTKTTSTTTDTDNKYIADINSDNNNKDAVNDNNGNIKTSINHDHKY